ncbi:C-type lectin domain family 2 member D-like isoform X1 [Falco peregrinus]|uniref:C-type lectin domain family 2 member D-like isoform X1 n=1 Tax=Falco peregrinus TaxID=8954 RepID=UPI000FFBA647|nr:C-type lectin domain family 2 member D-like isoform X1 [Falco peregrinus]XP_055648515.1 C-type lectin domain family 2 member D-like isoform X1 [Falco peregrinus]
MQGKQSVAQANKVKAGLEKQSESLFSEGGNHVFLPTMHVDRMKGKYCFFPGTGEDPPTVTILSQRTAEEGSRFSLKCIKDKKIPIGVTVVIAALLITIIALAAKKRPSCPSCPSPVLPSCLENGIGYRGKCFYFTEDEADWNRSQISCLSHGAHLATIDTQEELRFLLRYGKLLHYWVGLRREGAGPWKWFNESLFNNMFDVRGNGQCAYINADGISSDWCSQMKYFVCSHWQKLPNRTQKDFKTLLDFS